jgi:cyclase
MLNAVHCDGMMKGTDTEIISEACASVSVPVIAVGGVGSLADIRATADAGASAVGAGAFFVFQGPHRAVLISYPRYTDLENILAKRP